MKVPSGKYYRSGLEGAAHLVLAVRAACRADRGGCPTSPGVDLGTPSLEGVRAMLLVQRFKSGFFDFYRLAAPQRL